MMLPKYSFAQILALLEEYIFSDLWAYFHFDCRDFIRSGQQFKMIDLQEKCY